MNHLPDLIKDLALILAVAGIVALIFKRLKQPLVLGYIVAGFLAGPHLVWIPTIRDINDVQVWADIGVIVLLFSLGLEFSFKKIVRMGGAPIIAVSVIIFSMMLLGSSVGSLFGWGRMDCIYLGGMLAMSSTTIIYKAFQDLNLLSQRFTGMVLSVLILEDVLAIVLMVVLSTLALKNSIVGEDMLGSMFKLVFFLIVWFVIGLYLIPTFLSKNRKWINDEILLIVSLAFCFGMAVLAVKSGYSAAFGAFVVGSILAETVEAEHIGKLISPIKDLFGAIFFVSVGMLVEPQVLADYAWPIAAIVCTIILGQTIFGTIGYLVSGQTFRDALRCGLSMTQIGEFAFIIASLGLSLGVISKFLYPVVVAVSVITTFTTPYMIRLADPLYRVVVKLMPHSWLEFFTQNASSGVTRVNHDSNWKRLLSAILKIVLVYAVLSLAVIAFSFGILLPLFRAHLGHWWGNALCGLLTVLCVSPFLRAIMAKKNHSVEFTTLWNESKYNRVPLAFLILLRVLLAVSFVFYIARYLIPFADVWLLGVAFVMVVIMIFSRRLKLQSIRMEQAFKHNLRSREDFQRRHSDKMPRYARHLLSQNLHLSVCQLPEHSLWGGKKLAELNLAHKYGIHVAAIIRGERHIHVPNGDDMLFPGDRLQVIGSDAQLMRFNKILSEQVFVLPEYNDACDMVMRKLYIGAGSPFLGKSIKNSDIRDRYHCMVVGWETSEGVLERPDPDRTFEEGDLLWIVGEEESLKQLL